MKYLVSFLSAIILLVFSFSGIQASAVPSKSLIPSNLYDYTYKYYSMNGKIVDTETKKYLRTGPKRGYWKVVGKDVYSLYSYNDFNDKAVWEFILTSKEFLTTGGIFADLFVPGNLKKGNKGTITDMPPAGTIKYKVLSTNATVKINKKIYKNVVKVWYKGNTIGYYAKNRGLIKEEMLDEGEFKPLVMLTKVKKAKK